MKNAQIKSRLTEERTSLDLAGGSASPDLIKEKTSPDLTEDGRLDLAGGSASPDLTKERRSLDLAGGTARPDLTE